MDAKEKEARDIGLAAIKWMLEKQRNYCKDFKSANYEIATEGWDMDSLWHSLPVPAPKPKGATPC